MFGEFLGFALKQDVSVIVHHRGFELISGMPWSISIGLMTSCMAGIFKIPGHGEYRTYLTSKSVTDMRTLSGGAEAVIMGALRWELSPAGTACATSLRGRRKFAIRTQGVSYSLQDASYGIQCSMFEVKRADAFGSWLKGLADAKEREKIQADRPSGEW